LFFTCNAQVYTSSSIFAHNDYVHPVPFQTSYFYEVGYIEADIFLRDGNLFVAHAQEEITKHRTLDSLYLQPITERIREYSGSIYKNREKKLVLMIDLKTEGAATLNKLVEKLEKYPALLSSKTFSIAVSGNVPDPLLWKNYPEFIHFDGRPGIDYTTDQLARVSLISASFKAYTQWDGIGSLPQPDLEKIAAVIGEVHSKGKKIRFWATPDSEYAWDVLKKLKVDIINTDDVEGLAKFLKSPGK
jgi:alkaline phosphatase